MALLKVDQLRALGICSPEDQGFLDVWGNQGDVNEESCSAVADKFEWTWAAENLLNAEGFDAYRVAIAPAFVEYNQKIQNAAAPFADEIAAATEEYNAEEATARAIYDEKVAIARSQCITEEQFSALKIDIQKEYDDAEEIVRAKYSQVRNKVQQAVNPVGTAALSAYNLVRAATFGRLYDNIQYRKG